MGYNSDQFIGVNTGYADTFGKTSNPPFSFPGPVGVPYGLDANGNELTHRYKRGFMRLLSPKGTKYSVANSFENKKCFFQFNPTTITRVVAMQQDMMQPLTQDPAQFSLPVAGNSDFAFDILFDRQMEMNKGPNPSVFPDSFKDPGQVGVLVDVNAFDDIIGLGISKEMSDYMKARGEEFASWQSTSTTSTDTHGNTTTNTTAWNDSQKSNVDTAINNNDGNKAFLIPNPVRIVFSSLFQVDGFITGVTVNYTKFNRAMVPVQCAINVQMKALYLGFAREDTFLTYALTQQQNNPAADSTTTDTVVGADNTKKLNDLFSAMGNFRLSLYDLGAGDPNWDKGHKTKDSNDYTIYPIKSSLGADRATLYLDGATDSTLTKESYFFFPGIVGKKSLNFTYGFIGGKVLKNKENDPVYKAFLDGTLKNASYTCDIRVTRPSGLYTDESTTGTVDLMTFSISQSTSEADASDASNGWDRIRRMKQISIDNTSYIDSEDSTTLSPGGVGRRLNGGSKSIVLADFVNKLKNMKADVVIDFSVSLTMNVAGTTQTMTKRNTKHIQWTGYKYQGWDATFEVLIPVIPPLPTSTNRT